jgi:hypothetical protein
MAVISCNKTTTLPVVPTVNTTFSANPVHHTKDSVNVGDTVYLTASGVISDTTQTISVYLVSTYSATGIAGTFNYGTAAAPVKVVRTITGPINPAYNLYPWSATIILPGATAAVPHKSTLTITGNYVYQLSLSSSLGILAVTDAGVKNKTIYVK